MSWVIFEVAERLKTYSQKQEFQLAEAIVKNDITRVEQLLQRGVDPNAKVVGQTSEPLIFLVFAKNWFTLPGGKIGDRPRPCYNLTVKKECLLLLLEYGANPNLRDSLGRTVLEMAIIWCLPQIVKLLLLYGADPNLTDSKGMTPLSKTAILGIHDARPMLDKLQIIVHLLDGGADINAQTPDGKTALMYAVSNTRIEIVELLISSGASLLLKDHQGNQASNLISQRITKSQQAHLQTILTQPQLNLIKHQYQKFIPEGDRLLSCILSNQAIKKHELQVKEFIK